MPIHKIIFRESYHNDWTKLKYLCNQAVTPTKEKSSWLWKYVNCKNCLKQRKYNMQTTEREYMKTISIIVTKEDFLTNTVQRKLFSLIKRIDSDVVDIMIKIR